MNIHRSTGKIRAAAYALLLLASACSDRATTSLASSAAPNVVFVCMDTVRADHLGCYGYTERPTTPFLDDLASRSTLFLDASAAAGWTKPSVPTFLTGTYPLQHGVYQGDSRVKMATETDTLPDAAHTLAEAFSEHGYQTAAFVRNAQLRAGLGFEQGFDVYRDNAGDAREIRWRATDWLHDRDEERPFFLYLHFLDAHWPYAVPEEYAAKFVSLERSRFFQRPDWRELRKAINAGEVELEADDLDALIALYDGAIRFIDDELARLHRELERSDLARDTIFCVISDHGEDFLEHGRIGHGHGLFETLLHVPWILHVPGQPRATVDAACSLVDLYPTLLGAAGIPVREGLGVDRRLTPDVDALIFAEHLSDGHYQQSYRQGAKKTVLRVTPGEELESDERGIPLLDKDTRWAVEVVATEDGRLRADMVKPITGDDVDDPTELKGVAESVEPDRFRVNGVHVTLPDRVSLYGAGSAEADVTEGQLVKAAGAFDTTGVFVPVKIKLYEADAKVEREIRGRVTSIVNAGELVVGGVTIGFDDDTLFKVDEWGGGPKMSRERIAALIEAGLPLDDARLEVGAEVFDLLLDPEETAGRGPNGADEAERPTYVRFAQLLAQSRFWGAQDRATLSAEDLEALRAIGYAE